MKALFIILLLISFLHSDEMKRIESIIEDITKLRIDYEECQKSLKDKEVLKANIVTLKKDDSEIENYRKLLKEQRQKNVLLNAKIDHLNESSSNYSKTIGKYKKLLKIKDKEILALKNKLNKPKKKSTKKQKTVEICLKNEDDNPFPKLMPKENTRIEEIVQTTKAATFHLIADAFIYDAPNGRQIDSWTEKTSFTSTKKTTNWIKITGHFINRKWVKAKKEMWIENTKASIK
ncbi:hypothetical protein [Sulfurimonas sp.]|uniref:hypothetical protein n=1 Tax=Sulfurimonas sp. TaxID=2022749 RepID=UPI003564509E